MKKELNIAAILKEKPNTKVWSDTFGELRFDFIINEQTEAFPIVLTAKNGNNIRLTKDGRYYRDVEGVLPCIVPSKEMQDWSKLAWKKGDVLLLNGEDAQIYCIFEAFENDEYTLFKSRFVCGDEKRNNWMQFNTQSFTKNYEKASNEEAKEFIKKVEEHYGGKPNLETLQIEQPKQEFKDGDIVTAKFYDDKTEMICIFKEKDDEFYMGYCGVFSTGELKGRIIFDFGEDCIGEDNECNLRLATDSEKQLLFDALAKEGKAWDAEKKMLMDLPKKCEFEPFQKVLTRDTLDEKWRPNLFSNYARENSEYMYGCISGGCDAVYSKYCIPYNDSTKHLLDTTDEWEGGEG